MFKYSFGSPVFKDYIYSVISKRYITSFFRILLLSTSDLRMSKGLFCRLEVQIVKISLLSKSKISSLWPSSVLAQFSLCRTCSEITCWFFHEAAHILNI